MSEQGKIEDLIGWTLTSVMHGQECYVLGFSHGDERKTIDVLGGDFGTFGKIMEWDRKEDMRVWCFYEQGKPTESGHTWEQIQHWSDTRLEQTHDYIQYLCPNFEPSRAHPGAPVLTEAMLARLKGNWNVTFRAQMSVQKMLDFYGIDLWNWDERQTPAQRNHWICSRIKTHWLTPGNHNYLRLTRILKFCKAMDFRPSKDDPSYADRLMIALEAIAARWPEQVGKSVEFWRQA